MENDENSHTDNSTTYHNEAKRGLPKLKCPSGYTLHLEMSEEKTKITHSQDKATVIERNSLWNLFRPSTKTKDITRQEERR